MGGGRHVQRFKSHIYVVETLIAVHEGDERRHVHVLGPGLSVVFVLVVHQNGLVEHALELGRVVVQSVIGQVAVLD
ncbi:hypothetical protein BpHYR1_029596 [Brachionus plicatilis]|uniref:Uncharacterized protein n=1 Tax=Brachionus plicatilis TaxID=10195 RepID=A0A3M7SKR9_BRAPC|nr:hypothetical protein BpHYR1_029596 [Brachionus plicatilis]